MIAPSSIVIPEGKIEDVAYLAEGQIGMLYKGRFEGCAVVVKTTQADTDGLLIEAKMLQDLSEYGVRVPKVLASYKETLVMEYVSSEFHADYDKEIEAAKALAALHAITNESRMYGYYYDTTIASFAQKNEQTQYNWALFLGQMRILPMAERCLAQGALSKTHRERLERLCRSLYKQIDMSLITPSLLHGDIWSGNVIYGKSGVSLIDPAIYFGDREMELAFILLFDTFGKKFFDAYTKVHPLSSDFYEWKAPLYQLYPILVHIALYGGGYVRQLEERMERLGV